MAESTVNMENGENSSPNQDDSFDYDFFCVPCDVYDNSVTKAIAYCERCKEYLCNICLQAHKRLPMAKIHRIVNTDKLPKRLNSEIKTTLTEACKEHPREVIHYYCGKHDRMCCRVCIQESHVHCRADMQYIPDISYTMKDSVECDSALKEIQSLIGRLHFVRDQGVQSMQHLNQCRQRSLKTLKKIREKFERLEEQAKAEIDKFHTFERSKIEKHRKECDSALKALEDDCSKFQDLIHSGDTNRVFVSVKKTAAEAKDYNETVQKIHKFNTKVDFGFEEDTLVKELFDSDKGLGKLRASEKHLCEAPTACLCSRPFKGRKAVRFRQFDVRSKGKTGAKIRVFGLEVLPNGNIVMHCEFNMVKVFTSYYRPLTTITLEACPNDMAVLDSNSLVVTMPLLRKLQFLSIELRLKKERLIRTNKDCYGVAYLPIAKGRLAVAVGFRETAEIQILNLYGEIKIRIHEGPEGQLFSFPEFVTVGPDLVIHVSDSERQTVTSVKVDGTVVGVYKDDELSYPCGPAVDSEGNIYVGGQYSNNVHQSDSKGKQIQIMLSERDGIEIPRSLYVDVKRDLLFVPFGNPGIVQIYKLMLDK